MNDCKVECEWRDIWRETSSTKMSEASSPILRKMVDLSTTPLKFPLLSVHLRNLFDHGMTSLLIVHVPQLIHSCITLSFRVQIQNRLLHSDLKTQGYLAKAFQDTSRTLRPSRTLKNRDQHFLLQRAHTRPLTNQG